MWEPNNREKFQTMSKKIHEKFRQHEPDIQAKEILYLFALPAFYDWCTWTVYIQQDTYKLDKMVWHRSIDIDNCKHNPPWLFSDNPTIEEITVSLPQSEFDDLLKKGSEVSVPVLAFKHPLGLDGTTYGYIKDGIYLEWWESGPDQWQRFTDWALSIIEFFDKNISREKI